MMDALRLLDDADIARAYHFTPRELKYLLWHADPQGSYRPTDATIAAFFVELRRGLVAIRDAEIAVDVSGEVTHTHLTAIFDDPAVTLGAWTTGTISGSTTVTTGQADPLAGLTALRLRETSASSYQFASLALTNTIPQGVAINVTIHVRGEGRDKLDLTVGSCRSFLHLDDGTISPFGAEDHWTLVASIAEPNGWRKFVLRGTPNASAGSSVDLYLALPDETLVYAGDVTKGATIFVESIALSVPDSAATTAFEIVMGTSALGEAAQERFVDGHFRAFSDTADVKAKLVTTSSSKLVGPEARFGYLQPLVQRYVARRTLIFSQLATAFGLSNDVVESIVGTYAHARTSVGLRDGTTLALPLFAALGDVTGDLTMGTVPAYFFTYLHLQKLATIVSRLKLPQSDLDWPFVGGPLPLDGLSVVSTSSPGAFASWARLVRAARLRDRFVEEELFDIFQAAWSGGSSLSAVLSDIADRTGWSNDDLTYLAANLSPAITYPNDFKDEQALVRMKRMLDVCHRLELPAKTVLPWADTTNGDTSTEATAIKTAIRGTFDADAWPTVVKPTRDAIRERQRDAMVSYLVAISADFKDPVDLSDDVLMDVQVGACAKTSRIKQAMSSTQTFIQRVFLSYEQDDVVFTTDDARQWQWMKAFRVWEANRKIFLWPENWIEPTLRDNKSELFERLETDLSKGELTSDLIEDALTAYLGGLDEVARLFPVACVQETDSEVGTDRLHVVARTRAHPPIHYHRVRETNGRWLGWRRLDADVEGDHVALAVYNRRVHLLWGVFQLHAIPPAPAPAKAPVVQSTAQPSKRYHVRVRWTSLRHGKWSKVQQATRTLMDERLLDSAEEDALIKDADVSLRTHVDTVTGDLLVDCTTWSVKALNTVNNLPPYVSTNWLEYLRFTGCGSPEYQKKFRDPRRLLAPSVSPNANYYSWEGSPGVLGLPDVFNFAPEDLTPQNVKNVEVLSTTPSPYDVMTIGSNDDLWTFAPMLFTDFRRSFLITPSATLKSPTTTPSAMTPKAVPPDSTNSSVKAWSYGGGSVTSVLNFAQDPSPSGSGSYSKKLMSSVTPITRPTTHTAFTFTPFYHPYVCDVVTQLNRLGVERMYDPQPGAPGADLRRQGKSATYFATEYDPTTWVTKPYPIDDFDFTPEGAYSLYNWELFFHVPLLIATKLAADQQFEEARKWFHFIFNPTEPKSPTAAPNTEEVPQRFWKVKPFFELTAKETDAQGPIQILKRLLSHDDDDPERLAERKRLIAQVEEWRENPFEPHRIARLRPVAYMKTTVMTYLDMLIAWGDQLYARATLESINEALQIYLTASRVLGRRPTKLPAAASTAFSYDGIASALDAFSEALVKIEVSLPPVNDDVSVSRVDEAPIDQKSMAFCVPPNDKLLGYWDTVEDRLYKIRHCLNLQGIAVDLPLFEPPIDPGLLVRARAAGVDIGSVLADLNAPLPLQRYAVLSQRANELVAEVKSLGQSFLSALEKNDAEALAILRSNQEVQVMQAMRASKAQAVVETERAREALQQAREAAVARRDYYASRPFRNEDETQQADALAEANGLKDASQIAQAVAGGLHAIPTLATGTSGNGAHIALTIGGVVAGTIASTVASGLAIASARAEVTSQLSGVQGSFRRRMDDWQYQRAQAEIEIQNLDKQIAAADIREAIAQNDLATQDLQIQNAIDSRDFVRDKFTNVALYDYMVSQLAAVYFQAYKLAYDAAKRAERAWHFEIQEEGEPSSFISFGYWDGLRKGLLAGEKLSLDIKRMEMAYLDKNQREFELVRHVPLTMLDPQGLHELREKGFTEIEIPESFFDIDGPGHYLRRIRNVSITIAGTTGPYTPVRCTLTLLENRVRTRDRLDGDPLPANTFPIQSIVTSSARDDGGLFETNLRDERYLPFEGAGVVSKWRLELPTAVPLFDYRSIAEVVLHFRYTARDGGATFRSAVNTALEAGVTRVLGFSVKSTFADQWYRFIQSGTPMVLPFDEEHLPFLSSTATIDKVQFLRIQKTIDSTNPALTISPAPSEGSPLTLNVHPAELNGQATRVGTYSDHALANWTISAGTGAFTEDDDLIIIITYKVPGA